MIEVDEKELKRFLEIENLSMELVQKVSQWCAKQPEKIAFSAAMTFGSEVSHLADVLEGHE